MAYSKSSNKSKRDIVFHSALVELGPKRVRVDGDLKSNIGKNKDRDAVDITIDGVEMFYWCENEECAKFFKGKKGKTFTIVATGAKDNAKIEYAGDAPVEEPATERTQERLQTNNVQRKPDVAIAHAKVRIAKQLSLYKICLKAAFALHEDVIKSHGKECGLTMEQILKIATGFSINADRALVVDELPVAIAYPELKIVEPKGSDRPKEEKKKEAPRCPQCGDPTTAEGKICPDCEAVAASGGDPF